MEVRIITEFVYNSAPHRTAIKFFEIVYGKFHIPNDVIFLPNSHAIFLFAT